MVVKVEVAELAEGAPAIIRDRAGKLMMRLPATRPLISRMRGRLRAFFKATVTRDEVEIDDEAPAEAW